MADAKTFLISLISDNTVLYVTDKNARNWSFRYYLDDARLRLARLSDSELDLVHHEELLVPADSEKSEWLHTQAALETALIRFEQVALAMNAPSG